ncbi:MAG: hypothetical protein ACK2U1_17455 [Anaerolineales bacterium]
MRMLSPTGFARAQDYLHLHARPLEKALFSLEFEGGSVDQVLAELQKYQNADGGFGLALEPDLRTPKSSALCTELGLRFLAERNTPTEHSMVKAAVKYLLDIFETDTQVWRVIPDDANDDPHAPWWQDDHGSLAQRFDEFLVIPRAGILASLNYYVELVPSDWLASITEQTVKSIENLEVESFGQGGDTLVYALRLADSPGLAPHLRASLYPFLMEIADTVVARDPDDWSGYAAPPLKFVLSPLSPLADLFADELQGYLDYLIDQQTTIGTWEPTWNWGELYPADWAAAKQEWCGILTLETLIALRTFGRLAS